MAHAFIEQLMLQLGAVAFVPATEADVASIWIVEDDAPNGIAGYYERRRVPAPHRIAEGQLVFTLNGAEYQIQCHGDTEDERLEGVADVLRTLLRWAADRIIDSLTSGLEPFRRPGSEWWRILRTAPDATEAEIRAAFHRLARQHHPDHGGDANEFTRIQTAYAQALDRTPTGVIG